jgi:hypothetical protein
MCIIIDTNSLGAVFDLKNKFHKNFEPVFSWIFNKKGKIVIAGTTYKNEIKRMAQYRGLILQLQKAGKVAEKWNHDEVDLIEKKVKALESDKKFNDAHIIAMVIVTKRRIICTADKESYEFLKDKKLYLGAIAIPRIYRGLSNKNLLCKCNKIDAICDLCKPLNKKEKNFVL